MSAPVIHPVEGAIGALVEGVDLGVVPGPDMVHALESGLERHGVLVFPGQDLEPAAQVAFSRAFGELALTRVRDAQLPEWPEILVVGNSGDRPVTFSPARPDGDLEWHADHIHLPTPARASLLYCVQPPGAGGDTEFACTYRAYEALSPAEQAAYETLVMIHSVDGLLDYLREEGDEGAADGEYDEPAGAVHWPLVRRHPLSGRRALYFGSKVTVGAVGWPRARARELVERLTALIEQPRFRYTHRWSRGDAVLWDNRRVLHAGTHYDVRRFVRRMHRTTLVEDQAVR